VLGLERRFSRTFHKINLKVAVLDISTVSYEILSVGLILEVAGSLNSVGRQLPVPCKVKSACRGKMGAPPLRYRTEVDPEHGFIDSAGWLLSRPILSDQNSSNSQANSR
jgi:hypothetical protein